jgi:hypothetical protein
VSECVRVPVPVYVSVSLAGPLPVYVYVSLAGPDGWHGVQRSAVHAKNVHTAASRSLQVLPPPLPSIFLSLSPSLPPPAYRSSHSKLC